MNEERRAHARIAVPLDARLVINGQEHVLMVREISQGGVFLYSKTELLPQGGRTKVRLALTAGIKPVTLTALVTRLSHWEGELLGLGLHFVDVSQTQQLALLDLLDRAMQGPGTLPRAFPRVSYLLDVKCTSKTELGALLRDIGEGGAGLEVDRALSKDEEVVVEVNRAGHAPLRLHGYVVSCDVMDEIATSPGPKALPRFRAGLRFQKLSPELRHELIVFLRELYRR